MHSLTQRTLFFFGLIICLFAATAVFGQETPAIGSDADQNYAQYYADGQLAKDEKGDKVGGLLAVAIGVGGLVTLLLFLVIAHLARLTNYRPFAIFKSNAINARLFLVFFFMAIIGLIWENNLYSKYVLLSGAASEHGAALDSMMVTTLIITGIAFIITQTLLFFFAFLYRGRAGRTASYYHDNNKLELAWTLVPALVMAVLVLFGFREWSTITAEPEEENLQLELVAEQFQWSVRYAGKDNQLGGSDYRLIGGDGGLNVLGVDFKDPVSHDDIIGGVDDNGAKVLYLPKGRKVTVNIRAKDVLHGVYMPHFRVQMYAVPGMPTHFSFTPTVTTEEKRAQTGNPAFNYELACSQLCGSAHYNMRVVINVVDETEFKIWMLQQEKAYKAIQAAASPTETPESDQAPSQDNTPAEAEAETATEAVATR